MPIPLIVLAVVGAFYLILPSPKLDSTKPAHAGIFAPRIASKHGQAMIDVALSTGAVKSFSACVSISSTGVIEACADN